jgi:hypothetical protein
MPGLFRESRERVSKFEFKLGFGGWDGSLSHDGSGFRTATPKAGPLSDAPRDHQCDQAMLVRKECKMR